MSVPTSADHRPAGTALVTGGTGGIGAEICRRLLDQGHRVAFTYRSDDSAARSLVESVSRPDRIHGTRLDLTDCEAVAAFVQGLTDGGELRTVVHAAGPHIPMKHLSTVAPQEYRAHLSAEAESFFTVVHACLPALRVQGGSVVAVTTAATRRYPARDGLSSGTKAAVEALVRAFAAEEGRYGVRFNSVGPGMLSDGMAARLIGSGELDEAALAVTRRNIPLRRFGRAADVAAAVCFLVGPDAGYITGQKLDVDGGFGV